MFSTLSLRSFFYTGPREDTKNVYFEENPSYFLFCSPGHVLHVFAQFFRRTGSYLHVPFAVRYRHLQDGQISLQAGKTRYLESVCTATLAIRNNCYYTNPLRSPSKNVSLEPGVCRQTDRQIDRQTDRQIDRQRDRQRDRETERQTDRQTERQRDRQIDRQIDRQVE